MADNGCNAGRGQAESLLLKGEGTQSGRERERERGELEGLPQPLLPSV